MDNEFKELLMYHANIRKDLSPEDCVKKTVVAGCWIQYERDDYPGLIKEPQFLWTSNTCSRGDAPCPRVGKVSGDYTGCLGTHAEINLIHLLQGYNLQPHEIPEVVWVSGHYYACGECAAALKAFGIKEIRVREEK